MLLLEQLLGGNLAGLGRTCEMSEQVPQTAEIPRAFAPPLVEHEHKPALKGTVHVKKAWSFDNVLVRLFQCPSPLMFRAATSQDVKERYLHRLHTPR